MQWQVAQASVASGADPVLGAGALAVPQFQERDRGARGVGGEAGQTHAVGVGEPQLRAGVGSFLAHDQPHPGWPAFEDVTGQFGHPGTVANLAVGFDRHRPGRLRDPQHGVVDRVGDRHPDRVGQPPAAPGEPVEELVGAAGGVGADQGLPTASVLVKARG